MCFYFSALVGVGVVVIVVCCVVECAVVAGNDSREITVLSSPRQH